uniref:Uncharacterized protein n=1 Tax=viral metagenome TaxID=1070528 RepID=A0A6C0KLN7_9ZZZZ
MSKSENPKKVLKKTFCTQISNHNGLKTGKKREKSVTINFNIFFKKRFRDFFC